MSDQVVLITGALTGIGRAAAVIFAQAGAHVVVSGRHDKEGQELVAELRAMGAEAEFVRTDVRVEEDVRSLVEETIKRFGRLDIAVNNAGTEGLRGLVTEQTAESYAATFDSNVLGVLLSMKHELRAMLPQGSGSIVNVSSAYGSIGAAGASVYVASKHAVEGMTKSVALEVAGTGVRVNVVAPGTTDTGMLTRFTNTDKNKAALVSTVPVKRMATPEEIARVIAFVASADASYMTGVVGARPREEPPGHIARSTQRIHSELRTIEIWQPILRIVVQIERTSRVIGLIHIIIINAVRLRAEQGIVTVAEEGHGKTRTEVSNSIEFPALCPLVGGAEG